MPRTMERIDVEVCVDCLMLDACGPGELDEETVKRCSDGFALNETDGWHYFNACPEECEGGFSWSACDICGSTLGGDRHPGALIRDYREGNR